MKKKKLLDQLEAKNKRVNEIYDALGDADPNPEQIQELDTLEKSMADVEAELEPILKGEENRRNAKERIKAIAKNRLPMDAATFEEVTEGVEKSLGASFTKSEEYQAWLKSVAPSGRIPAKKSLQSPTIAFGGLIKAMQHKTLVTSGPNSGGALVDEIRLTTPVIEGFMRELTVSDLVTTIPVTNGDTIEYPRMNAFYNNADVVPEANVTNFTGAAGQVEGRKPESGIGLEVITDHIRTIAHWIPATTRILMDEKQLESLIEAFLLYGLKEKSENLMVDGDGLGDNFLGIRNTPGIQVQPFDGDILKTLRRARTKVKTPGRVKPTAYLMNPLDWEEIDLAQDNEGRYFYGGPTAIGNPRLWGLPVIESEAIAQGKAICGAWRFAVRYDRQQGTISASNSHADFFIRNMVAILAECREGFGVHYTKAFCEADTQAPVV